MGDCQFPSELLQMSSVNKAELKKNASIHATQVQITVMEPLVEFETTLIRYYNINNQSTSLKKIAIFDLLLQMTEGVLVLHNCNIVHGDISLGNFMLRKRKIQTEELNEFPYDIVLIDFESTRHTMSLKEQKPSSYFSYTPWYSSPFDHSNSMAADVFALGMSMARLYKFLATGNHFSIEEIERTGREPMMIMEAQAEYNGMINWLQSPLDKKVPLQHEYLTEHHSQFGQVLTKMMSKDSMQRPTIQQVMLLIQEARQASLDRKAN